MTSVTFRGIGKHFGAVHAVSKLDLEIPHGEFCVFVGPSGCGKTTALRMLAGLEKPTRGQILLGERDVTHERAMDRNIAMVFQNYALYPHMTVAQNMGFALRMQKIDATAITERILKAARMLAIENLLERFPRQLSGGQRQRVAVGRAIVRDPEVFLFDEPLSNLDAKLRNIARVELKDLQQRLGTTTVYVTHDQVEAMTMADRIVLMNEGRVLQVGRPMELYDDPASTYVATFMGSPAMNLLPARVLRSLDGGCVLDMDGTEVSVPMGLREGTAVMLGIRPEQIVIGHGSGEAATAIAVGVVQIEELGGETILHTLAKDKRIIVKTGAHAGVREKDVLSLRLPPSAIRLFDQDKGLRLA